MGAGDADPVTIETDGEVVEQAAGCGDGGGVRMVEAVVDEDDEHGVGALPVAERTEPLEDVTHRGRYRIVLAGRQHQVVAHDGADGRGPGAVASATRVGRETQHDQRPRGKEAEHGRHGGDQFTRIGESQRAGRGSRCGHGPTVPDGPRPRRPCDPDSPNLGTNAPVVDNYGGCGSPDRPLSAGAGSVPRSSDCTQAARTRSTLASKTRVRPPVSAGPAPKDM